MELLKDAVDVLFVEELRRSHSRQQQRPGIDCRALRVEGHPDGVGVRIVPQGGADVPVSFQPRGNHLIGACNRTIAAVRVSGRQDSLVEDREIAGSAQMSTDRMRRHACMAWDGQRLMFDFRGLVSLLHLVPAPSRR